MRTTSRLLPAGVLLLVASLTPILTPISDAATPTSGVTRTKAVSRVHLVDGHDQVVDRRTVTVSVDQTQQLRDRQVLEVDWKGAHPTGNKVADVNSAGAADQEYPLVLLECRGVDSTTAAASARLTPSTCWTQTPIERYLASPGLQFPPWRVDRYATPADRHRVVGVPTPLPSGCFLSGYPEHWLHFRGVTGTDYAGGPVGGCAGIAPEQTTGGSTTTSLPGNTTYGFSDADGSGQARFVVWNSLTNASLGCGPSVPCALVAVPVEGISCDVAAGGLPPADRPTGDDGTAAADACTATAGTSTPAAAVKGNLWWSGSNWRNRITIPLGFAPLPSTVCRATGARGIDVYGSELMTAATSQWNSRFCQDGALFPVSHVQTGETQARNLLATGNTDAAFTVFTPSGGYGSPVVSAPAAITGFAIGYAIDDAQQHDYHDLRLTPRLLAKLLTESYPSILDVKQGWAHTPDEFNATDYRALAGNPLNIVRDPEFVALNPGISANANTFGASTLLALSSESDVMRAVTAYINADPAARAWLDGAPDPWGMVVNPNYKGIALPVDSWPLLDTYQPRAVYDDRNPCLQQNPVPYLPLVASPLNRLAGISLDLQYAIQQSQVVCTGTATSNPKLAANGPETVGSRFIIGVTSLADALRYRIDTASLQTRVSTGAPAQFTDATGRTFVAPNDDSLRAAAALLTPDATAGTWTLPYSAVTGAAGSATAYPGTLLVSIAVPTKGLPATEAQHYADYLRFIAGPGQTRGAGSGQLPDGYLPLTGADGVGSLADYTSIAAGYVAAQNGEVPSVSAPKPVPAASSSTPRPRPTRSVTTPVGGTSPTTVPSFPPPPGTQPATGPGVSAPASSSPTPLASGSTAPTGPGAPASSVPAQVLTGATPHLRAGVSGAILPVLALLALVAGLLGPVRVGGRRAW